MDNLVIILVATLIAATPLIAAALGGMFSERSGVVNIGLEGMMTAGAFGGVVTVLLIEKAPIWQALTFQVGGTTFSLVLIVGLIAGALLGAAFGLLHAYLSITVKTDQTVSGVAINMITLGLFVYLTLIMFNSTQTPNIQSYHAKFLDNSIYLITIFVFVLVIISWYIFKYTKFGMHIDAVGENPAAADAMGINVNRVRYQAVIISGALAGVGGVAIAYTASNNFSPSTVAGKGFIALAVLLFAKRHSFGIVGAGIFFGFAISAATVIPIIFPEMKIDSIYFVILPYILTIIAITAFSRRSHDPKALGKAYDKEVR